MGVFCDIVFLSESVAPQHPAYNIFNGNEAKSARVVRCMFCRHGNPNIILCETNSLQWFAINNQCAVAIFTNIATFMQPKSVGQQMDVPWSDIQSSAFVWNNQGV